MADFDNTNRGSIWKNSNKKTETHPDFTGSINIEGKDFWLSAWKPKEGANPNAPLLSFSVQPKEAKPEQAPAQAPAGTPVTQDVGFNDSIPF